MTVRAGLRKSTFTSINSKIHTNPLAKSTMAEETRRELHESWQMKDNCACALSVAVWLHDKPRIEGQPVGTRIYVCCFKRLVTKIHLYINSALLLANKNT